MARCQTQRSTNVIYNTNRNRAKSIEDAGNSQEENGCWNPQQDGLEFLAFLLLELRNVDIIFQ
ncbi:hypothetical protein EDM56_20935 [Brevibacillus fluminis]|uniref:Uncharacterized protein n=1 Tax=Brevibacillus fluminis TaxID=511487 RepID=A0A3M8D952_9BACL|nr:hypothetical protein EDM56_20935 [Brevibacillus fluminis]